MKPTPGSQLALFLFRGGGRRPCARPPRPRLIRSAVAMSGACLWASRVHSLLAHSQGAPPHFASSPALALGNPVQSRPLASPAISCLRRLTHPPDYPTAPQTRATPVRECLLLRPLPAHLALPTFANGHKVSTRLLKAATGPIYPKSCPNHRPPLPLIAHSAAVTPPLRWIRS